MSNKPISEKIAVLCPTRERPDNLRRLIKSHQEKSACSDILFYFDEDDPTLMELQEIAAGYKVFVGKSCGYAVSTNQLYDDNPGYLAYMMGSDDMLFVTPGWDYMFTQYINGFEKLYGHRKCVLYGDDKLKGQKLCTFAVVSREFCEATGQFVPRGYMKHMYTDNYFMTVGENTKSLVYCPKIMVEHLHFLNKKAEEDVVYSKTNSLEAYRRDKALFEVWIKIEYSDTLNKLGFVCRDANINMVNNYYKRSFSKRALLSYIRDPFYRDSFTHTNYYEAKSWAKILDELGYVVDVIDYTDPGINIDFSRYNLLCGFGDVFQQYFESGNTHVTTIYYGTGMHVSHQNQSTLERVKDIYKRTGVYLAKSARFVEKTWTHQTTLVDGIITLGNNVSKLSYSKYYDGPIIAIPAPFYKVQDGFRAIAERSLSANQSFLWFGSSGLVHKGLDLVLDYFIQRTDLVLHICGPIKSEPDFEKKYFNELYRTKNIHTHDFVDIVSAEFFEILKSCSFIVFPSCSEGGSPGLATVIGNGGLIPIITRETTIDTENRIWINDFTVKAVEFALTEALSLAPLVIKDLQKKNLEYVLQNNSQENYYNELKKSILAIVQ